MRRKLLSVLLSIAIMLSLVGCFDSCESIEYSTSLLVKIDPLSFPDEQFSNYVSQTIDTNHDGFLSEEEMNVVTEIDVTNSNITSLKGIQFFENLVKLDCSNNSIYSLDLTHNTKIKSLICYSNNINKIYVHRNSYLSILSATTNKYGSDYYTYTVSMGEIIASIDKDTELVSSAELPFYYNEIIQSNSNYNVIIPMYIDSDIYGLVSRLYERVYGVIDPGGLSYWCYLIQNHALTPQVAVERMFSCVDADSLGNDPSDNIRTLFEVVLNREASSNDITYYSNYLTSHTVLDLVKIMADSQEFTALVESSFYDNASTSVVNLTVSLELYEFVVNVYEQDNWNIDYSGFVYWMGGLRFGKNTLTTFVRGFITNRDLIESHSSNSAYVELLYQLIFQRSADSDYWVNQLHSHSVDREGLLSIFLTSAEWINYCDTLRLV